MTPSNCHITPIPIDSPFGYVLRKATSTLSKQNYYLHLFPTITVAIATSDAIYPRIMTIIEKTHTKQYKD